jgi:hypothetical protein
MMKKRCTVAFVGLLAGALMAAALTPVRAQTHGGTGVLKIKPAARATGMGQAGVALDQRAHGMWWNPALLAGVAATELSSTVAKLVPDLADDVYYLNTGYAAPLGEWGGFGIDVMYLSYGKTEAVDNENVSHGFFNSYEFVPVIGFGTKVYGGSPGDAVTDIDLGVSLKYVLVDLAPEWAMAIVGVEKDGRADAFGLDAGILLRGELVVPYSVGVNFQNMGSKLTFIEADQGDPLPRNLKAGIGVEAYSSEALQVVAAFDFNKAMIKYPGREQLEGQPKFGWGNAKELWNGGIEISVQGRLHFRTGYVYDPEGEITAPTFGAGLDVGVGSERTIRFDYSSVPQALDLARVNYLSVGVQL